MNKLRSYGTIRTACAEDFSEVMRLYRQLNPDDPVLEDGADHAAFEDILQVSADGGIFPPCGDYNVPLGV